MIKRGCYEVVSVGTEAGAVHPVEYAGWWLFLAIARQQAPRFWRCDHQRLLQGDIRRRLKLALSHPVQYAGWWLFFAIDCQ